MGIDRLVDVYTIPQVIPKVLMKLIFYPDN
jgi:hypothetical protein